MTQLSHYSKIIAGEWRITQELVCFDGIVRQCNIEEYVEGFVAFVVCADGRYTNHHCYKTSRGALRAAGNWRDLPPAPPSANEIAEAADGMFAASRTEDELLSCADAATAAINTYQMTHGAAKAGTLMAYVTASYENALVRIRRECAPVEVSKPPAEHAQRQRVIDRALETGRKYEDGQVAQYPLLREVALDFVRTYHGTNDFVQNIAVRLVDYGTLSTAQLRGALNVMVAEARIARVQRAEEIADMKEYARKYGDTSGLTDAYARDRNTPDYEDPPYMDLRRKEDKQIADAGDAIPPASEAANEVAPAIPNGTYTVILDDTGKTYRTLRVKDCPAHFAVKPGTQLIEFLNGPDNTSDFTGFAFLAGRKVALWKKYRNARDLSTAADRLVADPMGAAAEYVKRSNRCFVCNRPLTTPESIARGIGPICLEKIGALGFTFNAYGDAQQNGGNTGRALLNLLHATVAERQAASPPVSAEQAQIDIDELFPE